jgi:hypothetical protein
MAVPGWRRFSLPGRGIQGIEAGAPHRLEVGQILRGHSKALAQSQHRHQTIQKPRFTSRLAHGFSIEFRGKNEIAGGIRHNWQPG